MPQSQKKFSNPYDVDNIATILKYSSLPFDSVKETKVEFLGWSSPVINIKFCPQKFNLKCNYRLKMD